MRTHLFVASWIILLLTSARVASQSIPIKNFVMLPDVEEVELSPSGKKLATLKRVLSNGKRVLAVEIKDLNTKKRSYPVVVEKDKFNVVDIIWASDRFLLLRVDFFERLFIENSGRNPKIAMRRLMVLDLDSNSLTNILSGKARNRFVEKGWEPQYQDTIISVLPREPNFILHELDWDARVVPQVFKVNLTNMDRKTVQLGREDFIRWVNDREGNIRAGLKEEIFSGGLIPTQVFYTLVVKRSKQDRWDTLLKFEKGASNTLTPMGFLDQSNRLLARGYEDGEVVIYAIDLSKNDEKSVFYRPKTSFKSELYYSNKDGNAVGYYTQSGAEFWDENYLTLDRAIDKALPDNNNFLKSLSADQNKYLVESKSALDAGTFYYGNKQTRSLDPVSYRYQALDPALMEPTKKITIESRDNRNIEAYLTLAKSKTSKRAPTILFSTPGFKESSNGGFNFLTQLWAHYGFNVLQVNFRFHRTGHYGFMRGGVENWAPSLINDLSDAMKWLDEKEIASANNTCLYGEGFGGYIALLTSIQTHHDFACVAANGSLSDIRMHLFNFENFTNHEKLRQGLTEDISLQRKFSPVSRVNEYELPVFLAHGQDNDNFRVKQSEAMYKALKKASKQVQYLELEGVGENLESDDIRVQVFTDLLKFFEAHIN